MHFIMHSLASFDWCGNIYLYKYVDFKIYQWSSI